MISKNLNFCKIFQKLELIRKVIVNGAKSSVFVELFYSSKLTRERSGEIVPFTR